MKVKVIDLAGKEASGLTLDKKIFATELREDILRRVVNWQLAKRRSGSRKTKGRSDVSGTTRKPHRQKGTGNARLGSLRAAQCRGGGIVFGPVVRSHGYDLPKKIRKLGLKIALASKLKEGKLVILKDTKAKNEKTKTLFKFFESVKISKALIIEGNECNKVFFKAASNIPNIDVMQQMGANVYDILNHEHLILTEAAVKCLEERLQ
jgi:large subunit ribosomal protein L4